MKKKLLILEDRFSQRDRLINLGDRALYAGLHKLIEQNLKYKIIMGDVKVFPYFNIKHFNSKFTQSDIEKTFEVWLNKVINFSSKRAKIEEKFLHFLDTNLLFNNNFFKKIDKKIQDKLTRGILETIKPYLFKHYYSSQLIKKIRNADIVLVNGGGLVADHLKLYLPMLMFEILLAKRFGKKVAVVNYSVSVKDPLNFKIVALILRLVDMHIVREPLSKKVLLKMGINKNRVFVSCDAAFAADTAKEKVAVKLIKEEGIQEQDVGVIIRGDRPVDYQTWVKVINFIQQECNKRVFFIFTCRSHDEKVFKKLSKNCRLQKLSRYYDYGILIGLLKHFDFVITDRYHGAVFAIMGHTPFIPVEPTTLKTRGLCRMIDYPIDVIKEKDDFKSIINEIKFVMKNKADLTKKLSKADNYLRAKIKKDIELISRL